MRLFEFSNIRFARKASRPAVIRIFKFSLRADGWPALTIAGDGLRAKRHRWPAGWRAAYFCARVFFGKRTKEKTAGLAAYRLTLPDAAAYRAGFA